MRMIDRRRVRFLLWIEAKDDALREDNMTLAGISLMFLWCAVYDRLEAVGITASDLWRLGSKRVGPEVEPPPLNEWQFHLLLSGYGTGMWIGD